MKLEYIPAFATPIGKFYFDDNDSLRKLFNDLYINIKKTNNVKNDFQNHAKTIDVTTHYDAWQLGIKTVTDAEHQRMYDEPDLNWTNSWWDKTRRELFAHIEYICNDFRETMFPQDEPESNAISWYMQNMWLTELKQGQVNSLHNHQGSIFSGVYYHTVPKYIGKSKDTHPDGKLALIGNMMATNEAQMTMNQMEWVIPEEGLLIIFPSSVPHIVYPFRGDETRVTFAFNLTRNFKIPTSPSAPVITAKKHGVLW